MKIKKTLESLYSTDGWGPWGGHVTKTKNDQEDSKEQILGGLKLIAEKGNFIFVVIHYSQNAF